MRARVSTARALIDTGIQGGFVCGGTGEDKAISSCSLIAERQWGPLAFFLPSTTRAGQHCAQVSSSWTSKFA